MHGGSADIMIVITDGSNRRMSRSCKKARLTSDETEQPASDVPWILVSHQIEQINSRFDDVNIRISDLDGHLGTRIDTVQADLGHRIDDVNRHLAKQIEHVHTHLGQRLDDVTTNLAKQIEIVTCNLSQRIDDVRSDLGARIDSVDRNLDRIDARIGRRTSIGTTIFTGVLTALVGFFLGRSP